MFKELERIGKNWKGIERSQGDRYCFNNQTFGIKSEAF